MAQRSQTTALGIYIYIANVTGKGKAHIGKMHAILTDSHLDTRVKRCILKNVIVPKLEYYIQEKYGEGMRNS